MLTIALVLGFGLALLTHWGLVKEIFNSKRRPRK